jgi:uncharacterized protein (TIGR03083 family)
MGADVSYLETLRENATALAAAARKAGIGAPVPSCPDWDVEKLVRHTGRVFTSCAAVVRERGQVDFSALPDMPRGEDAIDAFEERAAALADALSGLPQDFPIWNWFGIDPPIPGFYHRRMAQEIAVHRYDAELAAGTSSPIQTELAVDGIDEVLASFLAFEAERGDLGGSLHLHATDAESEWVIRRENDQLIATQGHEKADAAVRGTASDLLLFLWNRVPASGLDVVGDVAVAERWKDAVKF